MHVESVNDANCRLVKLCDYIEFNKILSNYFFLKVLLILLKSLPYKIANAFCLFKSSEHRDKILVTHNERAGLRYTQNKL